MPTISRSPTLGREVPIDVTVRRAQQGDPDAFGRLYDAHAPRIHAVCLRLSADPGEAARWGNDREIEGALQSPSPSPFTLHRHSSTLGGCLLR